VPRRKSLSPPIASRIIPLAGDARSLRHQRVTEFVQHHNCRKLLQPEPVPCKRCGILVAASVLKTKNEQKEETVKWIRISMPNRRPTGMDKLRMDIPTIILLFSTPAAPAPVRKRRNSKVTEQNCKRMRVIAGTIQKPSACARFAVWRSDQLWNRLRENFVSTCCARANPEALAGSVWLDLYPGLCALGLKPQPRAGMVHFFESLGEAADLDCRESEVAGDRQRISLLKATAARGFVNWTHQERPPYFVFLWIRRTRCGIELTRRRWGRWLVSKLVNASSLSIAEHEKRFDPGERVRGLLRSRKIGRRETPRELLSRPAS